ncbi:MAG: cytochrome c [Candidatus Hydrothermarchaeota archaeon]|jgi:mono/diheme cytochrome c family protein|nr:cytochrome c [Candidatus Hydrothermarchaeota archaeon]
MSSTAFRKITALMVVWVLVFVAVANTIPQVEPTKEKPKAIEKISIASGKQLVSTRGCLLCHSFGEAIRAPDLSGVGKRAETRVQGYTSLDYLGEKLVIPTALPVEGWPVGMMPPADKPPAALNDEEIAAAIMYLQSLGSKPSSEKEIRATIEKYKAQRG